MATQIVPQVVQHSVRPSVIPIVIRPANISQEELGHVLELRRQREALDERIKEAESAIRAALETGASVQEGVFSAFLKTVERELGEDYARRVLSATRADSFTTLVIGA